MSDLSGSLGPEKNDTETAPSDLPRRSLLSFEADALEAEMASQNLERASYGVGFGATVLLIFQI